MQKNINILNGVITIIIEEQYNECIQEPKNEELAVKVALLQKDAFTAKDLDMYHKATLLLVETLVFLQSYNEAIIVLQDALKTNLFEDYKIIITLSDKLIGLLLKTEDFVALESVLRYRERFIIDNPTQNVMQKFYESVCKEGLKKYQEAIDTLENINDTISNAKLVSKYLKLAMLYQKTERLNSARNAFEHALIFDQNKKNEMFQLVESDLLFAEGDYSEALKKFQEYFLKNTNKNRYLDRYIYLNIALGNLEEAWKFYIEYNPKMGQSVSKNYRYQFYQAGYTLAQTMKKHDDALAIKEKMMSVYDEQPIIFDVFDGVRALFAASRKKSVFAKNRDIILDGFRNLATIVEIPGLFFIKPEAGQILIYTFRKGLLLEKIETSCTLSSTIVGKILTNNHDYSLFTPEEYSKLEPIGFDTTFSYDSIVSIQSFKVIIDASSFGYIIAFLDKNLHFDYLNKLLITTQAIMESRFATFSQIIDAKSDAKAVMQFLSLNQQGLARIINGTLFLLDNQVKSILEIDVETMPYELFQSIFPKDDILYIDRLITKEKWCLSINTFQSHHKQLEIKVLVNDLIIYLAFQDVTRDTEEQSALTLKAFHAFDYDLASMHRFTIDYENILTASTIIVIKMINQDDLERQYSYFDICQAKRRSHTALRYAAATKLKGLYLAEDGCLLAIIATSDKRVIERIFRVFQNETTDIDQSFFPFSRIPIYHCGCLSISKPKAIDSDFNQLYEALNTTNENDNIRWFDKTFLIEENRREAIAFQIKNVLDANNMAFIYRQVGNLETRKVEMYLVDIQPELIPGDKSAITNALSTAKMTVKVEMDKYKKIAHEIAFFLNKTDVIVSFGVSFDDETLQEPTMVEEISRITKQHKIPFSRIMIIYQPSTRFIDSRSIIKLQSLKEKGFLIGWNMDIMKLSISNRLSLPLVDVIFCAYEQLRQFGHVITDFVLGFDTTKLIISNIDTEEQTKFVLANNISRIEGNIFSLTYTIDELISKLTKR